MNSFFSKSFFKNMFIFLLSLAVMNNIFSQATLSAKASSGVDNFVTRCYRVALNRNPEPAGFRDWTSKLNNGQIVGFVIAHEFIFSNEYISKNKTDDEYVKDLYMMFVNRDPEPDGYKYWMNQLSNHVSRNEVFAGFSNSAELINLCQTYGITAGYYSNEFDITQINNVNLFVERLYKTTLSRIGDPIGQEYWAKGLLNKELTGVACAANFINSDELINKNLSDEEYLNVLYAGIMGRTPDEIGYKYWLNELTNETLTRDQVFEGFSKSDEFHSICNLYGIECGEYTATDIAKPPVYVDLTSLTRLSSKAPRSASSLSDIYGNTYKKAICNNNGWSGSSNAFSYEYLLDSKYKEFKGTLYIPKGVTSNGTGKLLIKGDGHVLYCSPIMTKVSRPENIQIDITGVNNLEILWSHNSCYNYISDLECAIAEPQVKENNSKSVNPKDFSGYPVDIADIVCLSKSPSLSTAHTDNYGNRYSYSFENTSSSYELFLDSNYTKFKCTFFLAQKSSVLPQKDLVVKVLADGKEIYVSPKITESTKPFDIDINVKNCNNLTLEFSDSSFPSYNQNRVCFTNAYFYK